MHPFNIKMINHIIGVVGYFDGRVTKIEQKGEFTIVHWQGAASNVSPITFDKNGEIQPSSVM